MNLYYFYLSDFAYSWIRNSTSKYPIHPLILGLQKLDSKGEIDWESFRRRNENGCQSVGGSSGTKVMDDGIRV